MTVLTDRFDRALTYASLVHAGQLRKGTEVPYISHVLMVAGLVLEHGGTEDEAIGALLHDAVEDGGGPPRLQEIRDRFGDDVADIVLGCSDTDQTPKPPWTQRKQAYLAHLPDAPASVRLVSAGDKLANVRSITQDCRAIGDRVWSRFNAPKDDILWYYRSLANEFSARGPEALARELEIAVQTLESVTSEFPEDV
jgi:(p)ppGpp synthase/HD superfamily hydrolase